MSLVIFLFSYIYFKYKSYLLNKRWCFVIFNKNIRYKNCRSYNSIQAIAKVIGNMAYPNLNGTVKFTEKRNGTIIKIEVNGLPSNNKNNFFGFHIHEFGICNGENIKESFLDAGSHFDLEENNHPNHSGDMPVIYSNDGYTYMVFYTTRFKVKEIIGKSVIIHEMKDDFMTQPSGNSGNRIACGVIKKV